MLRRTPSFEAFEKAWLRSQPPDPVRGQLIYGALYAEARRLGVLPPADPLEGLEVDLRLARALNVRSTPRTDRSGA